MGKIFIWLLASFYLLPTSAFAIDPVAKRSERDQGMIWVKTPMPSRDTVKLTHLISGQKNKLKPNQLKSVPIGEYRVQVKMEGYVYQQKVLVEPTERTDVVVPGYGNLKINSSLKGKVEVYSKEKNRPIAKFAINEIRTLPRGNYDLKIRLGRKTILQQPDISVLTNTTRVVDIVR